MAAEEIVSCCEPAEVTLAPAVQAKWKEGKLSPQDHLSVLAHLASNEASAREVMRAVKQVQNLAPCSLGIFGSGFFAAALAHANTPALALDLYPGQKHEPGETLVHVPVMGDFTAFVGHFPAGVDVWLWENPNLPGAAGVAKPKRPFEAVVVLNPTPAALEMAWEQSADDGFVMVRTRDQVDVGAAVAVMGVSVGKIDGLLLWPGRFRRQPVKFV